MLLSRLQPLRTGTMAVRPRRGRRQTARSSRIAGLAFVCALPAALLMVIGCAARHATGPASPALRTLAEQMAGSFSSAQQAQADTCYFDIRLRMAPIWLDRTDGYWFYVEQAMAAHQDRPYRQRVYHLVARGPDLFESSVFTVAGPLRFAGAWKEPRPLAALVPDSLQERDGCSIILRQRPGGVFSGSTIGRDCPSELRGASYATSEVVILPGRLESWDRGFDAAGSQVWGATKGGYVFVKEESWSDRLPPQRR
jgi:hypothetical protein